MPRRTREKSPDPTATTAGHAPEVDRRALQILKDTYKNYSGFDRDPPLPSPKDYENARSKGLMFDPVCLTHDQKVNWLTDVCGQVRPHEVARGFLASLSGRLERRSALGCYAFFRHMARHEYRPKGPTTGPSPRNWCVICGDFNYAFPQDLNLINHMRFKWGLAEEGVLEAAFILERFIKEPRVQPSAADLDTLKRVLDTAASLSAGARPDDLEKSVAKILKTNKYQRRAVLEVLGHCGILQSRQCSSCLHGFVKVEERVYPPGKSSEWLFPMRCWRGSDGVDAKAVKFWFPELG
jgi:hypothetical protein